MSLQLYFAPGACSFVPHCLLELSGQAYEPKMVKLHKGEQYEAARSEEQRLNSSHMSESRMPSSA